MAGSSCMATIRGIPEIPSVTEVNVRSGPSTAQSLLFKVPVGTANLPVMEVQADVSGAMFSGKVYQWFRLNFPNGMTGWIRDDLLEIVGECSAQGYGSVAQPAFAFALTRNAGTPPVVTDPVIPTTPTTPTEPTQPTTPTTPGDQQSIDNPERVRKAAFAVTAAFEGHGYAAYQNYDRGIISYGRFQFALTGGLGSVVERYVTGSSSETASQLRAYLPRIKAVDESLRHDIRLRDLLIAAAADPVMQAAQDAAATENYWNRVMDLSVNPRGIQSPLGKAMLFDIGIQYGIMHSLIGMAEDDLKVPRKSKVGDNGITEQQLIAQVADRRKRGLYAQAERDNLPGLRPRADFWVNLINAGDWGFTGDGSGSVNVNGKIIQVRSV